MLRPSHLRLSYDSSVLSNRDQGENHDGERGRGVSEFRYVTSRSHDALSSRIRDRRDDEHSFRHCEAWYEDKLAV